MKATEQCFYCRAALLQTEYDSYTNTYLPDLVAELMALSARLNPSAEPVKTKPRKRLTQWSG